MVNEAFHLMNLEIVLMDMTYRQVNEALHVMNETIWLKNQTFLLAYKNSLLISVVMCLVDRAFFLMIESILLALKAIGAFHFCQTFVDIHSNFYDYDVYKVIWVFFWKLLLLVLLDLVIHSSKIKNKPIIIYFDASNKLMIII